MLEKLPEDYRKLETYRKAEERIVGFKESLPLIASLKQEVGHVSLNVNFRLLNCGLCIPEELARDVSPMHKTSLCCYVESFSFARA